MKLNRGSGTQQNLVYSIKYRQLRRTLKGGVAGGGGGADELSTALTNQFFQKKIMF